MQSITKARVRRTFVPESITHDLGKNYHWSTTKPDQFSMSGHMPYQWQEFSNHVLDLVDRMPGANGYYWGDSDRVFVVNTDITNDLAGKETRYQVDSGYSQHNTQFYKLVNQELGSYFCDLDSMFPEITKNRMIRVLVQLPGQCIPVHVDTFVTYRKLYPDADLSKITRKCALVSDWQWGHFFHYGNHVMSPWKAGDYFDIVPGVPHGSANAGFLPKITIQWDGVVD